MSYEVSNIPWEDRKRFYRSSAWKEARQVVIQRSNYRCHCCNLNLKLTPPQFLNVDHMLPLQFHWDRRLDTDHMQVLCGDCNRIKGKRYGQNWKYLVLQDLSKEYKDRMIFDERNKFDKEVATIRTGFSNEWYKEYHGRKTNKTLPYVHAKPMTYSMYCDYKALEYYWHYVLNYN